MLCGKRRSTALERYAKSLQQSESQEIPMLFPMYTVPVKDVLEMVKLRPHEELKDDVLVEFDVSMGKAAFISHQWLSPWNPDPQFHQFKQLQGVLEQILTSSAKRVDPLVMAELLSPPGFVHGLPFEEFRSRPLFIWYDYFSIPQIDDLKWSWADFNKPIDQALESIPAFVTRCEFFFVLAPTVENDIKTELFGLSTWAARGWCRMEKALKELQPHKQYVVIHGENAYGTVEAPIVSILVGGPPGEGSFGFHEDYVKLGGVLAKFLQRIVLHHLKHENFSQYRLYLNLQGVYLRGFPASSKDVFHPVPAAPDARSDLEASESLAAKFLFQHGFENAKDSDGVGWSPLCYAALRGDALVVRSLLEEKADPKDKTRKTASSLGVQKGMSALTLALYFGNNEVAQALIEARASLTSGLMPPIHSAAMANNAEGIRILCQAGGRPWEQLMYGITALQCAACTSSTAAIQELLVQSSYTIDLSGALMLGMVYNRGTVELVNELVKAKTDVNDTRKSFTILWWLENFRYICGVRTPAARIGRMSFGATPLMFALAAGQHEGAAALIVARANLDPVNYRGQTALDLAREFRAPQFLIDALENDPRVCTRMVSSALNNRYLIQEKFRGPPRPSFSMQNS